MATHKFKGQYVEQGKAQTVEDYLAEEIPFQIIINNNPFTITMCSPTDLLELSRGLLYTENVYRHTNEAFNYLLQSEKTCKQIHLFLEKEEYHLNTEKNRNLISVSSCGICGTDSFESIEGFEPLERSDDYKPEHILSLFQKMKQKQILFNKTGGTHAAALACGKKLLSVKEDIGRHNAVDKVIGHALLKNELEHARLLMVSGRVSYEIISKAYYANIPTIASISAPSALAVRIAEKLGITLIAFCREKRYTKYTNL